jgi:hypothetical protein
MNLFNDWGRAKARLVTVAEEIHASRRGLPSLRPNVEDFMPLCNTRQSYRQAEQFGQL